MTNRTNAVDRPLGIERIAEVNRELWLLLSMFGIAGLVNWLVASHGMILGLYTLPTLFAAYIYGRRHAVMTALASVLLVVGVVLINPYLLVSSGNPGQTGRWFDVIVWGGLLNITAYAMGTLYDRKETHFRELRRTYFGILMILERLISKDQYTHDHSYRVAVYASAIATRMGFDERTVDDIRAAALLHDIGKLEATREILHKAAGLSGKEVSEMRGHEKNGALLAPVGGSLSRILPLVLSYDAKRDGTRNEVTRKGDIPMGARVLSVADAYDRLTSDRPYRRAITPFEARDVILKNAGGSFDPDVVKAFLSAFEERQMELPDELVVI